MRKGEVATMCKLKKMVAQSSARRQAGWVARKRPMRRRAGWIIHFFGSPGRGAHRNNSALCMLYMFCRVKEHSHAACTRTQKAMSVKLSAAHEEEKGNRDHGLMAPMGGGEWCVEETHRGHTGSID